VRGCGFSSRRTMRYASHNGNDTPFASIHTGEILFSMNRASVGTILAAVPNSQLHTYIHTYALYYYRTTGRRSYNLDPGPGWRDLQPCCSALAWQCRLLASLDYCGFATRLSLGLVSSPPSLCSSFDRYGAHSFEVSGMLACGSSVADMQRSRFFSFVVAKRYARYSILSKENVRDCTKHFGLVERRYQCTVYCISKRCLFD
jgi:hypothetical protein